MRNETCWNVVVYILRVSDVEIDLMFQYERNTHLDAQIDYHESLDRMPYEKKCVDHGPL